VFPISGVILKKFFIKQRQGIRIIKMPPVGMEPVYNNKKSFQSLFTYVNQGNIIIAASFALKDILFKNAKHTRLKISNLLDMID